MTSIQVVSFIVSAMDTMKQISDNVFGRLFASPPLNNLEVSFHLL